MDVEFAACPRDLMNHICKKLKIINSVNLSLKDEIREVFLLFPGKAVINLVRFCFPRDVVELQN